MRYESVLWSWGMQVLVQEVARGQRNIKHPRRAILSQMKPTILFLKDTLMRFIEMV